MSIDGLFPKTFSKVHPRFKTPFMSLIIQGLIAFVLSTYSKLADLISFSVFNLAFSFLLVCLSFMVLKKSREKGLHGQNVLPWLGLGVCIYLIYATSLFNIIIGSILILLGMLLYIYFSPKTDIYNLKEFFTSEEAILARNLERKNKFLANFVAIIVRIYRGTRR